MEKTTQRFTAFIGLLIVASGMQFLGIGALGAVPNYALVIIVLAALFVRDIWHELFLLALAVFLLKFSPDGGRDILAFFVVGAAIIVAQRYLPWHTFINGIFLITMATVALYALIAPAAILSLIFGLELVYNIALAVALYHGLSLLRLFREHH